MPAIEPGLLILQGNRLELLKEAVFGWLGRHPLEPLEEEVFLVQSNGVAEWLKMALAGSQGICAATRVELPARFLWRSYRQVLGAAAVPARSTMDKTALTWRLLKLLPSQLEQADYAPLARFLASGDWERRLQLSQRLADLFDQYQVYRSDWLRAWEAGLDTLPRPGGGHEALPQDQRWQALLWRELVRASGEEGADGSSRSALHRRFVAALEGGADPVSPLPRRVVLFGMSSLPQQTLQALAALAHRCQVLLAIPNPCRYHWADIIEGRELLLASRRRHPYRGERDLSGVSLQQMHAHAHPLLAAWGRQGRDFVRQLDQHDEAAAAGQRFAIPRVDLFDEDEGEGEEQTLLAQVQARIRDLVPLAEHAAAPRPAPDRSIVFHVAHSAQREVEILHDQLLALLAEPGAAALAPRDIVVMVPDVEVFAPAVQAVFGQYARQDPRHIPFNLADQRQRATNPLMVALEWLLRLPHQRGTSSELQSLWNVPAIAARFDIAADDLPVLERWMTGAGIRWGVHAGHRAALALDACGEQNSWLFGQQRMLLGFASGSEADFADIEPYGEIGGLEAALVGSLAALVAEVARWIKTSARPATPQVWATRLHALLTAFFAPADEGERSTLAGLQEAMRNWLEACSSAGFEEEIPLTVVREAWLSGVDEPSLSQRFLSGGVTFCTLLPMRAVPFQVVCLLGMNDGDYPRNPHGSDFDLMSLASQRRPGDRSRREDDRYLMLEALLSARKVLYVSWTGRSVRDNSPQPASVLVSQLREYLDAGWGRGSVDALTTEHPLQPFSRRYFEGSVPGGSAPLVTYAREWREAHAAEENLSGAPPAPVATRSEQPAETPTVLDVATLTRFLKNPVKSYFRHRLNVVFDELPEPVADDESFAVGGLEAWKFIDGLVRHQSPGGDVLPELELRAQRLARSGQLPMGALGERARDALVDVTSAMLQPWQTQQHVYPLPIDSVPLRIEHAAGVMQDWLEGLRTEAEPAPQALPCRLALNASNLIADKRLRGDSLIEPWIRSLAASVCERPVRTVLVGRDAVVTLPPIAAEDATAAWQVLMQAWQEGMAAPLPFACRTGLALLRSQKPAAVYEGGDNQRGEVEEACLARVYPDFAALAADGRFEQWATVLLGPLQRWLDEAAVEPHTNRAPALEAQAPG